MLKAYAPYSMNILDILQTEFEYPGLLSAVDVALWQDELIDQVVNPKEKST